MNVSLFLFCQLFLRIDICMMVNVSFYFFVNYSYVSIYVCMYVNVFVCLINDSSLFFFSSTSLLLPQNIAHSILKQDMSVEDLTLKSLREKKSVRILKSDIGILKCLYLVE